MPRTKNYDRDTILTRAMNTFWLKGFSATSVNDLVQGTGLNRFSLYQEFENKEKLYEACFQTYQQTIMENRMSALEQDKDGIECLRRFYMNYIRDVKKSLKEGNQPVACLTVLNAVEDIGLKPEATKTMQKILKRMTTAFETVLKRAKEQKEISPEADVKTLALFLVGSTYGLDITAKYLPKKELETYVNQVLSSLT